MIKPSVKNNDSLKYGKSDGKELIVTLKDDNVLYLVFDDKKLIDIEIDNMCELPLHTKCVGKVSKINENINAAYIKLPDRSEAFLRINGMILKCEQNIPVEIIKAASKGKLKSVRVIDEDISHKSDLSIISYGEKCYVSLFKKYSFDRVITDNESIYKELYNYMEENVIDLSVLHMYNDNMVSLNVLFDVTRHLKEASSKMIWLKSGANIVIEETAAFTVIDVNTAKNSNSADLSFLSVNKEAADEIFRQMNIRNISGIILVDFINMSGQDETELKKYIKELCAEQKSNTRLVDITKLGIAEITRKKVGSTLSDLTIRD